MTASTSGMTDEQGSVQSTEQVTLLSAQTEDDTAKGDPFLPAKLSRLSALAGSGDSSQDDIQRVGHFLRMGSLAGFLLWLSLLALVHYIAPPDSYELLEGPERNANILVFILLLVTNGSRLLPLLFRDKSHFIKTGAMVGSCTIQLIALTSVAIMATLPTPVLLDEMTGRRVHLVRWAEWTPLAFLMTFLTEGIDMPNQKDSTLSAWAHAIAIALSTSAGLVFPFCHSWFSWSAVFAISCVLFTSLYIRLYQRTQRFRATQRGTTVDEQEQYDRVRLSLRLLQACSIMWTLLVVAFCVCCIVPHYGKQDSWWASPALPLVAESVFEIGSKVWYLMLIVDVHELVFDEGSRAVRRLEEMRDIMSVVWDSSSDVIVLCVKGKRHINAVVSPTFLKLSGNTTQQDDNIALVFEVKDDTNGNANVVPKHKVVAMNMSLPVTQEHVQKNSSCWKKLIKDSANVKTVQRNICSMAQLIAKAWHPQDKETLLMHELYGDDERVIQCEAKMTKLDNHAVVIVLRDISERYQRFEAEKQLVIEVTERKKDAQANRFTRHEVKNGLLAAIGLVDSLKESMDGTEATSSAAFGDYMARRKRGVPQITEEFAVNQGTVTRSTSDLSLTSSEGGDRPRGASNVSHCMAELDSTLREILDTVLSEAMARDVVHEVYEPRKERIDVPFVLYGGSGSTERFPLHLVPSPFPQMLLDPQLLRYIHRNAVSNACKYGEQGGQVTTEIFYHDDKKEFQMNVINLPGDGHEGLVNLDEEAVKSVFLASTRLHDSSGGSFRTMDESLVSGSAGDGAWVMQKCANALGGMCSIAFVKERTIFSLTCPAEAYLPKRKGDVDDISGRFQLPENTWGIAIDDSGIQRKLLARFLALAGVPKAKQRIMGKDAEEVLGFTKFLADTIRDYPDDKFLVIVDENLDILDGGAHQKTVSGSLCVKKLREELDPADESRLLALIRSANDSGEDVALYKSRAHGFLPKAPIQRDRVLELIEPWWAERFPSDSLACGTLIDEDNYDEGLHVSSEDLLKTLEVIDALCANVDEVTLAARWPAIREKMHALKGDLKTMKTNARVTTVLKAMEKLKGQTLPDELLERWKLIRSLIVSIL